MRNQDAQSGPAEQRTPKEPMRHRVQLAEGWRFSQDVRFDASVQWSPEERDLLGFEPTVDEWDGVTWSKAGRCYGPAAPALNDDDWRAVSVPHDWCVEHAPHPDAPIRNGFLPMGVGWYRRELHVPNEWASRRVFLRFEGVFRACKVFVNGHLVGVNESGYLGFEVGIDPVLEYGRRNVLAVRVDARNKEGWFYEGCGLYRPVELVVTDPLRVAFDGVHAQVEVVNEDRPEAADLTLSTEVCNDGDELASFQVRSRVFDPAGCVVGELRQQAWAEPAGSVVVRQRMEIAGPEVWSLDNPQRYRIETHVVRDGRDIDAFETHFGVRSVAFDAKRGLLLNGQPVKLKGVCCHQDHAGVGSAVPESLQVWRIERLKEMGANAYRCAHNPPDRRVLEACDRLGVLVIDEARVFGISREHIDQAERMIRRDRNHPCVILWSLANEEMAVQVKPQGARMFAHLKRRLKRLDNTRGFTAAINNGWDLPTGFIEHEDVHGLNYFNQGDLDRLRRGAPDMPVIVSEASSAVSTRGVYETDAKAGVVTSYDTHVEPDHPGVRMWPFWGREAESSWKVVAERRDLAGTFVWTGFDYRGEQSPYVRWPCVGSHFGLMDQCGFPKDVYWYYKAWWGQEPVLHVFPHWNWDGREGQDIEVWAYSNADRVSLELDGRSLGDKPVPRNGHVVWRVPYEPGSLSAQGVWRDGSELRCVRRTAGPAVALRLDPQTPTLATADDSTAMAALSVIDAHDQVVPTAMLRVDLETEGAVILSGVGNGDPNDQHPGRIDGRSTTRPVFHGLAQIILRSTEDPYAAGAMAGSLIASADGLRPARLHLGAPGPAAESLRVGRAPSEAG
ncbi:MAG: glycoside hydrolase family 2 TIM barrel-domain containing protein [Planctomycetota bacterium]